MKSIVTFLVGIASAFTASLLAKRIFIFIISMIPILELRGGILAAALLDMDPLESYIICVLGNIIVIPIALFILELIFKLLRKINFFDRIISKIENKCLSKKDKLEKYGYLGLVLFVGIPVPGTGAWTGCFLASLLNMDKKKSFIAALIGVLLASVIMMILSFGVIKSII